MTAKHTALAMACVTIVTALLAFAFAVARSHGVSTILWIVFWVVVVFVLIGVGQIFFLKRGKA